MATAVLIASRSNCERLHVGCVIVTGGERKNRIVAAGYNGFLPGSPHVSRVRDGHEQAVVHAEQNAVADAARRGSSVEGCVAYVTHFPCIHCAKIVAAVDHGGIARRPAPARLPLAARPQLPAHGHPDDDPRARRRDGGRAQPPPAQAARAIGRGFRAGRAFQRAPVQGRPGPDRAAHHRRLEGAPERLSAAPGHRAGKGHPAPGGRRGPRPGLLRLFRLGFGPASVVPATPTSGGRC